MLSSVWGRTRDDVIVVVAGRTTMAYDEELADRVRARLEDEPAE
jgi:hypothetical protein